MAVLKPRERLVYFRISEDEFRQFVNVCEKEGARSVSDLARSAVQRLIADGRRQREEDEVTERMYRLERLVEAVTKQLQMLAASQSDNGVTLEVRQTSHECLSNKSLVDGNGRRKQ